jgi:serine/threonine-protein kinase HipA
MKAQEISIQVFLTTPTGQDLAVGRLVGGGGVVGFEYLSSFLASQRPSIDPEIQLYGGMQYPPKDHHLFGVFRDQAPDRWGRVLMDRRATMKAKDEGRKMAALGDFDYLLGVQDISRLGALRYLDEDGRPLALGLAAPPPVTSMGRLEALAQELEGERASDEKWLRAALELLVAPSSSLGGARPKACFIESDGTQWLAKFPARQDRYDVAAWEYLTHAMARAAGIDVPEARLERFGTGYHTFCSQRFDRTATGRVHYVSAMTLTRSSDGEAGKSYLNLAEAIVDYAQASTLTAALEQMYRRMVFNVAVANRDDHLRNHGFLDTGSGWNLSPAFDMNPSLDKSGHALSLDGHVDRPTMKEVLEMSGYFRLSVPAAKAIHDQVLGVVSGWEVLAKQQGIPTFEREMFRGVFL